MQHCTTSVYVDLPVKLKDSIIHTNNWLILLPSIWRHMSP